MGVRVHVVAGGGSGSALLRRLVDEGYDVSAGVLPLFDTDASTAQELGVPASVELPFAPVGAEALAHFDRLVDEAAVVVVAAFPVGPANLANLERLRDRADRPPVLLMAQPPGVRWDYTGGAGEEARRRLIEAGAAVVDDPRAVLTWLSEHLRRPGPGPAQPPERHELDPGRP